MVQEAVRHALLRDIKVLIMCILTINFFYWECLDSHEDSHGDANSQNVFQKIPLTTSLSTLELKEMIHYLC